MTSLPWHRPERRAHRLSLGIGIAFSVAATLFALGLPGVDLLPVWFYRPLGFHSLSPSPFVWALVLVGPLAAVSFFAARRGRVTIALCFLVLTSLAAQGGVVAMDRGTLVYRLSQGHGEFFRVAHERRGLFVATMRDYPELAADGTLGAFAPSKPPGTLAFYMLVDALGDLSPIRGIAQPVIAELRTHPSLAPRAEGAAAGAILLPLFTALALIPVFFAARRIGGTAEEGIGAALICGTAPCMLLINYHADGALFPLVAALVIALMLRGRRHVDVRRGRAWLACSGAVFGLGIWSNFSMIPLVGFLGAFLAIDNLERGAPVGQTLARSVLDLAILIVGAAVVLALLSLGGLFTHPLERLEEALEYHRVWKGGAIGGMFGLVGALEYWLWAGLPLLFVSVLALSGALHRIGRLAPRTGDGVVLSGALLVSVIALSTGCVEAARLWLWVTPIFALAAARKLRAEAPLGSPNLLWAQLVAAQLGLTIVMRFCQPW